MLNEQKVTPKLRVILSGDVKGYSLLISDNEIHNIQTMISADHAASSSDKESSADLIS